MDWLSGKRREGYGSDPGSVGFRLHRRVTDKATRAANDAPALLTERAWHERTSSGDTRPISSQGLTGAFGDPMVARASRAVVTRMPSAGSASRAIAGRTALTSVRVRFQPLWFGTLTLACYRELAHVRHDGNHETREKRIGVRGFEPPAT